MPEESHRLPTQWKQSNAVQVGWMRQFRYLCRMYDLIADVPGDIVECGIGEGTTFAMLAYLAGSDTTPRVLRGFDSFQGFPEPAPIDDSWRKPQKGEWAIEEAAVRTLLETASIPEKFPGLSINITPGFLNDTLPKEVVKGYQIAFLHLDVDIYPSYRDGLENLFPLVAPGGVVLFDEYKEFSSKNPKNEKWPGATKAIDEYLLPLGYEPQYYPETKKYFVIKR